MCVCVCVCVRAVAPLRTPHTHHTHTTNARRDHQVAALLYNHHVIDSERTPVGHVLAIRHVTEEVNITTTTASLYIGGMGYGF